MIGAVKAFHMLEFQSIWSHMKIITAPFILFFALSSAAVAQSDLAQAGVGRCVVLLHGLARTETSFAVMEAALETEGYKIVRPGYPSTEAPVEELTRRTLPDAVAACGTEKVDFVIQWAVFCCGNGCLKSATNGWAAW